MNFGIRIRVEKGGEEEVYKCPKCRRPKFYVNFKKAKAHCFWCSYRVRLPRMLKNAVRSILPRSGEPELKPLTEADLPGRVSNLTPAFKFLHERGVDWEWAESQFWCSGLTGRWAGRLIIPIREGGRTYSWVARVINGQEPKELHGPNTSKFLYGYDQIREDRPNGVEYVILVEGIFDQIHLSQMGYPALALMGSHISDAQIGKLLKLKPSRVILMLDGDEAGREATDGYKGKSGAWVPGVAERLGKRMNPLNVDKIYLPEGKDPDDLTRAELEGLLK